MKLERWEGRITKTNYNETKLKKRYTQNRSTIYRISVKKRHAIHYTLVENKLS